MESSGEQTPHITKFWRLASRVFLITPALLMLDHFVVSYFNVRPMYGVIKLRPLWVVVLLIGGTCGYLPTQAKLAFVAIPLSLFLLVFSSSVGLCSLLTHDFYADGHLIRTSEFGTTDVFVYGKLPWSPTVYEGRTGLPGSDLEEMNDEDNPAMNRIIVGDGKYWRSSPEQIATR